MPAEFTNLLQKYADLAVHVGLDLQPGQRLLIRAPIATAPLARLIAASAYKTGATLVDAHWTDEEMDLARFRFAPRDSFDEHSEWRGTGLVDYVERGDAILSISADNPDLLKGQDPDLISAAQRARLRVQRPGLNLLSANATNWLVISAPTPEWAAKVFPDVPADQQEVRLWEAIFAACRLDQADPVAAWREHLRDLRARSEYLNAKQYATLKYSAPGTDLTIGLPQNHFWASGRSTSKNGISFAPNMPTEEVFTMPHALKVDGYVSSSRPLNNQGQFMDEFRLTFQNGRVVDVSAAVGEENLRKLIATDEGAARLGEVALVPHNSPIAQSGLLFYNTLFDENAASHLALGRAYPFTINGGNDMTEAELAAAGCNSSIVHTDFMIGNAEMNIDGVRQNGETEPVMRNGKWAFDV